MKYKHDEVIRAWLDGKTVQPKPDVVRYVTAYTNGAIGKPLLTSEDCRANGSVCVAGIIKYTIDGETGKLKSAEVV